MIEIRLCADEADKELSLAIYNEVVPEEAVSAENVADWETAQIASAEFVATLDGRPAGSVAVGIGHARAHSAQTLLTVLPSTRRRGVGSALYREISEWARTQGAAVLHTNVLEREADGLEFAQRRGFRIVARDTRMVLELANLEPAPVGEPAGIEIVRCADRPELARGIHAVALESHPDVPGSEDWSGEPFEVWLRLHKPELCFAAVAGKEVVGFAELFTTEARPGVAVHMMIGVKRAWRRRGIAGALKRAQIAWAKEAGYESLDTANEIRNEPIRRLNERLGYREAPGRLLLRGPLAPSCAAPSGGP